MDFHVSFDVSTVVTSLLCTLVAWSARQLWKASTTLSGLVIQMADHEKLDKARFDDLQNMIEPRRRR